MLQNEIPFKKSFLQRIPIVIPFGFGVILLAILIKIVFLFYLDNIPNVELPLYYCYVGVIIALIAISFSFYIAIWIFGHPTGSQKMNEIGNTILQGSQGFFSQQYGTITKLAIIFAMIIGVLYGMRQNALNLPLNNGISPISDSSLGLMVALGFLFGAFCSGCSGYAGMWVSIRTNIRVAQAARKSYNIALQLAFSGGYFGALFNVALAILGVAVSFIIFFHFMHYNGVNPSNNIQLIPLLMVGFGFGASFVAMFAQLGGGIYTKAADVGADLLGKLEQGFPEDDERNPAVIADLVGDNVGDCAGQSADLFESITAEIISAMILGASLSQRAQFQQEWSLSFMFFPLILHSLDVISSTFGYYFVYTQDCQDQRRLEDPLDVMKRGYQAALSFGMIGFIYICYKFLNPQKYPQAWIWFAGCGICGLVISYLFMLVTQFYTDYKHGPVQRIVNGSKTGHATNIIAGLAVGMESTGIPVIIISAGILISFHLGKLSGITDKNGQLIGGLFGTAIATMGMLCTGVYVLSMSGFGPIADNAGGIVVISGLPASVRKITDRLDAAGNVTKANAKGYSVGSAALACFLLFSAFIDEVNMISKDMFLAQVDIAIPQVFVAGLLGSMTVFIFASWSIAAVGNAAHDVIKQAKQQVTPQVKNRQKKPNYAKCVAIVTAAGQREMTKSGLLSLLSPIAICLIFRLIGIVTDRNLLGAQCICSYLMFSTATGILMAIFLNNGGGAWDNAKKYCEIQGWKNKEIHKASVTGDIVGDPCKDTAGPSIHILIKLLSTITLVMVPILV